MTFDPVVISNAELDRRISEREKSPPQAKKLKLARGSSIKPEAVRWVWDGYLARGKPHVLAGAPGTGKTTIGIDICARITSGTAFPDGYTPDIGNVIIWSGEDDPGDTLVPRLLAADADMDRVFFVGRVDDGRGERPFDPASDLDALLVEARKIARDNGQITLLMVDPIVCAVTGDSHKNAETRRSLQPLLDVTAELDAALLGISHFTKGTQGRDPIERITGSLAFGAVPRVVMAAAKQQATADGSPPQRIFCRAKSNIGPDGGGFVYDLGQVELFDHRGLFASRVMWSTKLEGAAREILDQAEEMQDDGGASSSAEEFLREELREGPVNAADLKKAASDAGHSWITIRRTADRLGVKREKETTQNGPWRWSMSKVIDQP